MVGLGLPVLDAELGASVIERVDEVDPGLAARGPVCLDGSFLLGRAAVRQVVGELDAVVGQHGVDLERHGFSDGAQEVSGDPARGFLVQLHEGKLAGAVDGDEQVQLALFGADFGNVDVHEADRVSLEPLAGRSGLGIG